MAGPTTSGRCSSRTRPGAERHINAIRSLKMNPPDHLVFATGHIHPTKNLPETSPEAFTHPIDYYFAGR